MGFNCGIVGLPNVGKSTLFNALTATQAAEAANYPFCTIEPNLGRVAVPDERLEICAALAKSAKIIPTQLEFVDIAGLVRGASRGEGLGNQFLGHIRAVDAIAHVLRCFEDRNITHVEGAIDPIRDAETVETELMLADLESLERRLQAAQKKARGVDKEAKAQVAVMEQVLAQLREGKPARAMTLSPEEDAILKSFYKTVNPWGAWGPIREKVVRENPGFKPNHNFLRDMLNVAVGMTWQLCLTALPIYIVLRNWPAAALLIVGVVVTTVFLKFNWYDKLEKAEPDAEQGMETKAEAEALPH